MTFGTSCSNSYKTFQGKLEPLSFFDKRYDLMRKLCTNLAKYSEKHFCNACEHVACRFSNVQTWEYIENPLLTKLGLTEYGMGASILCLKNSPNGGVAYM